MTKSEIIAELAQRCDVTQTSARQFYEMLNEAVMEGLRNEQMVKIKGLGTFKTVSVKARRSVSVNGGEEIEIPAHDKVAFTAEKGFAELVNEPLAHLEVVELDDASSEDVHEESAEDVHEEPSDNNRLSPRMKKLDEEAETLKGLLADINGVTPVETTHASSPNDTNVQPLVETEPVPSSIDTTEETTGKKTTHGGMLARIFICILLLLLVCFGVFYWVKFSDDEVSIEENKPVVAQTKKAQPQKDVIVETTEPEVKEEIHSEPAAEQQPSGKPTLDELRKIDVDYSQTLGTETVRAGSRLTMISLRAFGDKGFWIYIYLANRDQLSSPGMVRAGMIIKIPKLDSRLTDVSNPDCLKLAKELEERYVK